MKKEKTAMGRVIVTCDSTCDLTPELYQKYEVHVAPLYVRVGDGEYRDGITIDAETLFRKVQETGELPKTAAVSVDDYMSLWKPFVEQGCEVVHINISSHFSSCYQNACLAAQELGHVYPVDSLNLSSGSGHLVIEAALLAKEGRSGAEIQAILDEKKQRLNVSFVLDTMEYLAKGGRCSSVVAFAAGLLKLRLCIEVKDGKMDVHKKYRGRMNAVLCEYVRDRLKEAPGVELDRIFITTSGVPEGTVEAVRQAVLEMYPFKEVLITTAGCTISSHCGPGCLGILFFNK